MTATAIDFDPFTTDLARAEWPAQTQEENEVETVLTIAKSLTRSQMSRLADLLMMELQETDPVFQAYVNDRLSEENCPF